MQLHRVWINYELTGTVDVDADSATHAHKIVERMLDRGWLPRNSEIVCDGPIILEDQTELLPENPLTPDGDGEVAS